MRWIITGGGGQLGRCLAEALGSQPAETLVAALPRAELDVSDRDQVVRLFERQPEAPPDVLVNAAAFNAVDRCEKETLRAERVNGEGPGHLADVCAKVGVRLVHVSTDYVFDGEAETPYREDAPTAPRSAYGHSKLAGELQVLERAPDSLVVRTSWVFGPGRNFVVAILEQARLRRRGEAEGPLRVVDDQRGCPTYAADLADGILALVAAQASGLCHLTNEGAVSWWQFAREILDRSGAGDLAIDAVATHTLEHPAWRPRYSVLDCTRARTLGVALRPWSDALAAYLATAQCRAIWDLPS